MKLAQKNQPELMQNSKIPNSTTTQPEMMQNPKNQFHNNPNRDDAKSQTQFHNNPPQTQPNPKPTKTKWNKSKRQKETNPQGAKKQKEEK